MPRVLLILEHAFMAWMLIDALRRRADGYWYLVIFVPFGEWFYFFKVKVHDPEWQWLRDLFHREKTPTVESLRYQCSQTPSLTNRLRLGQALHDANQYLEASELFSQVLASNAKNRDAILGLALCRVGLDDLEGAVGLFEELIEAEPSFDEYQPWLHLSRTLWRLGRHEEALEVLVRLVKRSPRPGHSVALAHLQIEAGRSEEARLTLRETLEHFEHAPKFFKRNNRAWARQAKRMLKRLGRERTAPTARTFAGEATGRDPAL